MSVQNSTIPSLTKEAYELQYVSRDDDQDYDQDASGVMTYDVYVQLALDTGLRIKWHQFEIGDLAIAACGEATIGRPGGSAKQALADFAWRVGVGKKTMQDWRQMATFWPQEYRQKHADHTWTFLREGMREANILNGDELVTIETVMEASRRVERAMDQEWSVEKMRTEFDKERGIEYSEGGSVRTTLGEVLADFGPDVEVIKKRTRVGWTLVIEED